MIQVSGFLLGRTNSDKKTSNERENTNDDQERNTDVLTLIINNVIKTSFYWQKQLKWIQLINNISDWCLVSFSSHWLCIIKAVLIIHCKYRDWNNCDTIIGSVFVMSPLVYLQATSGGQKPDQDGQHKFMVQSIFAPTGQISGLEKLVNSLHSSLVSLHIAGQNVIFVGISVANTVTYRSSDVCWISIDGVCH